MTNISLFLEQKRFPNRIMPMHSGLSLLTEQLNFTPGKDQEVNAKLLRLQVSLMRKKLTNFENFFSFREKITNFRFFDMIWILTHLGHNWRQYESFGY